MTMRKIRTINLVPKESQIQAQIKEYFELHGFIVQHTSAFKQKVASGVTPGVPDLLIWYPGVPLCVGIEVKRDSNSLVRIEQQAMVNRGCYKIAWNLEEAVKHVSRSFRQLGDYDQTQANLNRMLTKMAHELGVRDL